MKKLVLLITSILAAGTICVATGCHGNQGGPRADKEGGCEDKKLNESVPEFKFRPHRPYRQYGDNLEEESENDDENENPAEDKVEPIRPHKKRPHKNDPTPKPMPVKPKK